MNGTTSAANKMVAFLSLVPSRLPSAAHLDSRVPHRLQGSQTCTPNESVICMQTSVNHKALSVGHTDGSDIKNSADFLESVGAWLVRCHTNEIKSHLYSWTKKQATICYRRLAQTW